MLLVHQSLVDSDWFLMHYLHGHYFDCLAPFLTLYLGGVDLLYHEIKSILENLLLVNIMKISVSIVSSAEASAFAGIVSRCVFNSSRRGSLVNVPGTVELTI